MAAGPELTIYPLHTNPYGSGKPAIAFVVGGGALTPLSPGQVQPQIFDVTNSTDAQNYYDGFVAKGDESVATSCTTAKGQSQHCYIAIYPADRSRFYRHYEGGLRVKYYPAPGVGSTVLPFPAILDFTIGQNEYVSGGTLRGPVFHMSGTFPVSNGIYAFGGMDLGLSGKSDGQLPLLTPATDPNAATSQYLVKVRVPPPNRDRYSLGVAIDLLDVLRKHQAQDALKSKQSSE